MAVLVLVGAALAGFRATAAAPAVPAPPPSFAQDVAPIFKRWCVSCHGERETQSGLRLDSYEAALKGGDDGPVIVPGDPAASQLLAQIERRTRPPMPPKKHLPHAPAAIMRAWITAGALP